MAVPSPATPWRRRWWLPAVLVWAAFAGWVLTADADGFATTTVVDLTETSVPVVAGVLCLTASRRVSISRAAWALCGLGMIAWGLGQAVWSWYEVALREEVPFPSGADVGYLAFPVLASVGLLLYHGRDRLRRSTVAALLDGALVTTSLFALSWLLILSDIVDTGFDASMLLLLAYPVGDLALVTLVLHTIAQQRAAPVSLWLLGGGLLMMAVADSAFIWGVETGSYSTGGWIDLSWITAFAVMGLAGLAVRQEGAREAAPVTAGRLGLLLPYVPFVIGTASLATRAWTGALDRVELVTVVVLVVLVVARQYLTLADNHLLLASLRAREAELQHLALHDPLTGLANRTLLRDRTTHAATERTVPGQEPPALLLVDLDDFKEVNDVHGHAAGDALLVEVAERLRGCVRDHDTVSRLGGDEFALLLHAGSGADEVAERVLGSLARPVDVEDVSVTVSASVGIGMIATGIGPAAERAARAMRQADVAMYAAKAAGKNRWRRFDPDAADLARPQDHDRATHPLPAPRISSRASNEPEPA